MMDWKNSPRQLPAQEVDSPLEQNALILNQNSSPCAAKQCDSMLSLLRRALPFRHLHEQNGNVLRTGLSFIPDLILVRISGLESAQDLIDACRKRWKQASIWRFSARLLIRLSMMFRLFSPAWMILYLVRFGRPNSFFALSGFFNLKGIREL